MSRQKFNNFQLNNLTHFVYSHNDDILIFQHAIGFERRLYLHSRLKIFVFQQHAKGSSTWCVADNKYTQIYIVEKLAKRQKARRAKRGVADFQTCHFSKARARRKRSNKSYLPHAVPFSWSIMRLFGLSKFSLPKKRRGNKFLYIFSPQHTIQYFYFINSSLSRGLCALFIYTMCVYNK